MGRGVSLVLRHYCLAIQMQEMHLVSREVVGGIVYIESLGHGVWELALFDHSRMRELQHK